MNPQKKMFGVSNLQVQGLLLHSSEVAAFPPDDHGHVDCILHVHTHFGQVRVALQQQPSQQDANAPQSTMLSAEVGYQLQRSMLWAASCLTSSQAGVQAKGSEILDKIDLVERCVPAGSVNSQSVPASLCAYQLDARCTQLLRRP